MCAVLLVKQILSPLGAQMASATHNYGWPRRGVAGATSYGEESLWFTPHYTAVHRELIIAHPACSRPGLTSKMITSRQTVLIPMLTEQPASREKHTMTTGPPARIEQAGGPATKGGSNRHVWQSAPRRGGTGYIYPPRTRQRETWPKRP